VITSIARSNGKAGKNIQKTNWVFFPKSIAPPPFIRAVVGVFESCEDELIAKSKDLQSNGVLALLCPGLQSLGFEVETGKRVAQKIRVPVLFGRHGIIEKSFEADAWHRGQKIVVEVEAGRGYLNNQFLKDLFQACMMHDVDYCGIAIRNRYLGSNDFENVISFFETLYTSGRLQLPLKGVLIIGYGNAT
jgi:hypothetical protein